MLPTRDVECVRIRVRGEGRERGSGHRAQRVREVRRFTTKSVRRKGRVLPHLSRDALGPGARCHGPLRVDERTGTTFVPEGWTLETLGDGTLRIRRRS